MAMRVGVRRWWLVVVLSIAALAGVAGILLAIYWPFTRDKITHELAAESKCTVRMRSFRQTFFPYPGCVAEDVRFERPGGVQPIGVIRRLHIEASWAALFSFQHRLRQIRAEALAVHIPTKMPPPAKTEASDSSETIVEELNADGAVLEVARTGNPQPLRFEFFQFTAHNLGHSRKIHFSIGLHHPEPPGELRAQGSIGPWNTAEAGQTPVSASFQLSNARLDHYQALAGTLTSRGSLSGALGKMNVRGQVDVSEFEVDHSGNPVQLNASYSGTVDGLNGDTELESVNATFLHTTLIAHGNIGGQSGAGNIAAMDFDGRRARIQDLILMFSSTKKPAMAGPIVFRAHAVLPSGHRPFLRRLRLDGRFDIDPGHFTKEQTEEEVNTLSARARGDGDAKNHPQQTADVKSSLAGTVHLSDGMAKFPDLVFTTPGAAARGAGTFNVITKRVRLRGKIATEATVSQTEPGIKSILLKPLDVFFKKKKAGAVLPVTANGTYPNVSFQVSLTGK